MGFWRIIGLLAISAFYGTYVFYQIEAGVFFSTSTIGMDAIMTAIWFGSMYLLRVHIFVHDLLILGSVETPGQKSNTDVKDTEESRLSLISLLTLCCVVGFSYALLSQGLELYILIGSIFILLAAPFLLLRNNSAHSVLIGVLSIFSQYLAIVVGVLSSAFLLGTIERHEELSLIVSNHIDLLLALTWIGSYIGFIVFGLYMSLITGLLEQKNLADHLLQLFRMLKSSMLVCGAIHLMGSIALILILTLVNELLNTNLLAHANFISFVLVPVTSFLTIGATILKEFD